jgi:hypothetical protein
VAGLRHEVTGIRDWYRSLWLRENRVYALDRVMDGYNEHLDDLTDVERRVGLAIGDLDRGHWLPVPGEVRLWIEGTEGWYFREWLVSGPIPGASLASDLLASMGGETSARPAVTQEYPAAGGIYRWRRFVSQEFARVNVGEVYEGEGVVYACATIDAGSKQTTRALAGSSGPLAVFLNGSEVHRKDVLRSLTPDEDEFLLPLVDGKNVLMIKILKPKGDGGFTFRVPDLNVRNRKNRYRIVE